ncbi:MAG: hypothetical protein Q4G11_00755 [Gallicola sp.]|nr:hypothetical protein [Gallicola sp.]
MKNTLQNILDIDSYAKELREDYEKKEKEIILKKNEKLRLLDQHLETVAEEERIHFKRVLDDYEKENLKILDHYKHMGMILKENYKVQKEPLIESLSSSLLESDDCNG